jgi:hypothetical protein
VSCGLAAADVLGSGVFKIKITINLADGSEMTCIDISADLVMGSF